MNSKNKGLSGLFKFSKNFSLSSLVIFSIFFKYFSNNNFSVYRKLTIPHDDFYKFIFKLEDIFIENFPPIVIENNVGTKIKDLIL